MTKKQYPLVHCAYYMVKRDGQRCACQDQEVEAGRQCHDCWHTGFSGGYFLHSSKKDLYCVDYSPGKPQEGGDDSDWSTRTFRSVESVELMEFTQYAIGDFLVDLTDGTRWKVITADANRLLTRKVQTYEAVYQFPVELQA